MFHISNTPFLQFRAMSKTRMYETSQRTKAKYCPKNGVSLFCDTMGAFVKCILLHLRDLGKDMEKQWRVEHDELVQEFTRLTTDQDGLVGVLEKTLQKLHRDGALHEHGDDAQREQAASHDARKLLCLLIQVQNYLYGCDMLHLISFNKNPTIEIL